VLSRQLTATWVRDRLINLYRGWARELTRRLQELKLRSILDLRGRRELLSYNAKTGGAS
jgi:glutamate synthase domain-containing protein 2